MPSPLGASGEAMATPGPVVPVEEARERAALLAEDAAGGGGAYACGGVPAGGAGVG